MAMTHPIYKPPDWPKDLWHPALCDLANAQTRLNCFLWDSDFIFAVVSQTNLLGKWNDQRPGEAFRHLVCSALLPTNQGKVRCRDPIRTVRRRLEQHTHTLFPTVLFQFFTHFEGFVRERFGGIFEPGDRIREVGRPVNVWKAIQERYPRRSSTWLAGLEEYTLDLVLRVDVLKWIRNVYAHVGANGLRTFASETGVQQWETSLPEDIRQRTDGGTLIQRVKDDTLGAAARGAGNAKRRNRNVEIELFYTLFTFTNIRNLAEEMDRQFNLHAKPAPTSAAQKPAGFRQAAKQFQNSLNKHKKLYAHGSLASAEFHAALTAVSKLNRALGE